MRALSIAATKSLMAGVVFGSAVLMPLCAQTTDSQGQTTQAVQGDDGGIRALQEQLAAQPGWMEGWWKLGTLAYESDRYDVAKPALLKVVAAAPQMGTAWSLLGLSEFELKEYPDAVAHLQRANKLGYGGDEEIERVSVYHYALLLIRDGQFELASGLLEKTFARAPNAQVRFALGLAMLRVPLLPGEVDPAKEALINAAGALALSGDHGVAEFPAFVSANSQVPFVHYAYGVALEQAGRAREALTEMQAEASVTPWSPVGWRGIARVEQQLGEVQKARAAALKAASLERNGGNAEQARLRASYAIAAAGVEAANGANGTALWDRAMGEYASGAYAQAAADLKPWLKDHPNDGTAWAVLGLSEYALHDYDSALLHLQRGSALGLRGSAESVKMARYTAGVLLVRAGQFEAAADVLGSVAKLSPGDPKVLYLLGLALLRRAQLPNESASDAGMVRAAGEIAVLLQDSRYDEAFPKFKALLRQYPNAPFLHYAYGTALMALSEFDEAANQMRAETVISPKSPLPYVRLASVAVRQHRAAEAIEPAKRAIALDPDSPDAHYLLGRACLETGDDATAIRELEQASKLDPGSPEVHFNLARAYARAKMMDQAAAERATFARLSELAQAQKSGNGSQIYTGPRGQGELTSSGAGAASH